MPSKRQAGPPHRAFRSLIFIHNDPPTTQIPVESSDVTAALITTEEGPVLIASVYLPGKSRNSYEEQALYDSATARLTALGWAIEKAKQQYGALLPLVVGGDFNRHDPVWGGFHIPQNQYAGEGEPVLHWMHQHDTFSHHSNLGRDISFKWIPERAKVPAHVEADQQAKAATAASSTNDQVGPRLAAPDSVTYSWNRLRETISLWAVQTQWKLGNRLRATDSAIPEKHTLTLYNTLNKKEATILLRLRTGHSYLKGFLAKINVADSDQCSCGRGAETTRHFLLFCPNTPGSAEH